MSAASNGTEKLSEALLDFCGSASLTLEGLRDIISIGHSGRTTMKDINYEFFFHACQNESVNGEIIQCLLEHFPAAAHATNNVEHKDEKYWTPLHAACSNKNITLDIVRLLIDAMLKAKDPLRSESSRGSLPLHVLCNNNQGVDENEATAIVKFMLEQCPESIRHANNDSNLPLHMASAHRGVEVCRLLAEAYPESLQIRGGGEGGFLPLHLACTMNNLFTVKCLYKMFPDAVNHATTGGEYPIHLAIVDNNIIRGVDIVRFLLDCDPRVKLQKFGEESWSLLLLACAFFDDADINIELPMQIIEAIYDAHPEAIEDDNLMSNINNFHPHVITFIQEALDFADLASNLYLIPFDENGQLPLHHALCHNVGLGSIKLLCNADPNVIGYGDSTGALPLHLACQYHDSPSVVQYLIDLDPTTLQRVDSARNTALHYACREAKYDLIAILLENFDHVLVSKRNFDGKLPVDLLFESDKVQDRESDEYIDCVFRLLKAHPYTLMKSIMEAGIGNHPSKRRKIDGSNNASDYNSMLLRNQSWEYSADVEPFSHWIAQGITESEAAYRVKTSRWLKETTIKMRRGEFPHVDEHEDGIKLLAGIKLIQKYRDFAEYSNDEILPHWEEFASALRQFNPVVVSNSLSEDHSTYFEFGNFRLSQDLIALIKEALIGKSYSVLHFDNRAEVEYEYGGLNIDAILDLAESNTQLRQLLINCITIQVSNIERICHVVRNHPSLVHLDLRRSCDDSVSGNRMLESLLSSDTKLRTLAMRCNGITNGVIVQLAHFLRNNSSLIKLNLQDNQLGGSDCAEMLANALEKNKTLRRLGLKDNDWDNSSTERLQYALYNTSSLNAMSDSNHYCELPELDGFLSSLNVYEEAKDNRCLKIYTLLSARNFNRSNSNLQDFHDIDTKMLPKVLEAVQQYDNAYPDDDDDDAEHILPRVGSLSIVYEIMWKWDKVFNVLNRGRVFP